MPSHPRARDRRTQQLLGRVIAFAKDPTLTRWIEQELSGQQLAVEVVNTVREMLDALIHRDPPHAQIVVVDFDAMTPAEVLELHGIRDAWFGAVIGVGTVTEELRTSLNVERVLDRSLRPGVLRTAVAAVGLDRATTKMTKLTR